MQFRQLQERLAQADDSASTWREALDREYHQFKDTVAQWQAVQADRVAAGKEALADRWRKTELRTRYKELEYRLKMQRRRLAMLQQAAFSAA
jgi:stearoyl-CoA desaturase (delta-9 desaturase)